MSNLTISIPHQLGRAEAKRRIQDGIVQLKQQHGQMLEHSEERWTGDTLSFSFRMMGQTVSGHAHIEDQVVRLEVPLPWPLSMLAQSMKPMLEQEGRKLLGPPPKG